MQGLTRLVPVSALLLGSLGLGACATKGYVREQVAVVSDRVGVRETRLQATDGKASQALAEAQPASGQIQGNAQRLEQLNSRVDGIEQRLQQAQLKRPRN